MRSINPNFKIKLVNLTNDTQVNAGNDNTQTLRPLAGKIYKIIYFYYYAPDPVGSAAGTHDIRIQYDLTGTKRNVALCKATTGNIVAIGTNSSWTGDSSEVPSTATEQHTMLYHDLWASYDFPLYFLYENDTDVNQTGTRVLEILVKEYPAR